MSGYLLLRDNKQTGPYSKDEIIAKGFKPYDLIWAEGKSAGWRYPGELPEFSAFAPMVEEQPFDRFFKKPVSTEASAFNKASIATSIPIENKIPEKAEEPMFENIVQPAAKVINLPPRKIFVTLPGAAIASTTKAQPAANRTINPEDNKYMPAPVIPEKAAPGEKEIKPQPVSTASYAPTYNTSYHSGTQFIQDRLQSREQEEKLFIPAATRKTSFRGLFIGTVAACLLLGGVIIGLLISNNKQSSGQDELNSLVKQIQQREAAKKQILDEQQSASTTPVQQAVISQSEEDLSSKHGDPKTDDNNSIAKSVSNNEPIAGEKSNQVKTSEILTNEVQKNKNPESKLPEADKAIIDTRKGQQSETARQNIYQLVSIAGSDYKTGVLGGISNLELTVSNNSLYPIDQVEVLVSYMNIEKKIVKKETVIINDVAAGEQKTIPVPKSKRGVSVTYNITKINSRALGLAHSGL